MTTCSRQSVQVHPSKEGRLFHYRQVHRCPVRTYEGRSYPVFLQMASLFPAIWEIFCSGAPALPRSPSRKNFWCVLPSPALRAKLVRVKEAPGNAGEPRQSRSLRGRWRTWAATEVTEAHALRLWRNLIQPVRHVSTMAHARAQKKHRRSAAHVTAPSLEQRPSLFAGKRQRGPRDRISFRAMIFSARPPCSERHRPVPVPPGLPPNSSSSRARPDVVLKKRATTRFQPIPF